MTDWRNTKALTDEQRGERARGRRDKTWWTRNHVSAYLPPTNDCRGCDDCRLDREDENFLANNTPERRSAKP